MPFFNNLSSPFAENLMLASVVLPFCYFLSLVTKFPIFVSFKRITLFYFPSPAFFKFKVLGLIISFSYEITIPVLLVNMLIFYISLLLRGT